MIRRRTIAGVALLFACMSGSTVIAALPDGVRAAELIGTIEAPGGKSGNTISFGTTLGISGNRLFVGAPSSPDGQSDIAGLGFLYDLQTLDLVQTLHSPALGSLNYFGASAAPVGEEDFVIGGADGPGTDVAFLFEGATGTLRQTFTRTPSPNASGGSFASVATVDDKIYFAALDRAIDGKIFQFDAVTGALERSIADPPPLNSNDAFAASLVATDDSIIVGAFRDANSGANTGSVFIFDSQGEILHRLSDPTPRNNDQFGRSLALVDGRLAVGSPVDDAAGPNSGSAYLFDVESGEVVTTFLNPSPDERDLFGFRLANVGNHLLIAAPGDENVGSGRGAVYQYDPQGNLVSLLLNPSNGFQTFGWALASADNRVFVGAPSGNRVYVFQAIPEPTTFALIAISVAVPLVVGTGRRVSRTLRSITNTHHFD